VRRRRLLAVLPLLAAGGCLSRLNDIDADGVSDDDDPAPFDAGRGRRTRAPSTPRATDDRSPETVQPTTDPTPKPADTDDTTTRPATPRGDALGPLDWTSDATERGRVTVDGPRSLSFSVYRCHTALARVELGDVTGDLPVAFDYRVEAEMWYESRVVAVLADGERRELGAPPAEEYGATSGRFAERVAVDGPTTLVLGLEPSDVCGNPDHGTTRLVVENLRATVG